ncbi:MAG: SH3 domain-containing protein, partial [Chloroflexota bacterium]
SNIGYFELGREDTDYDLIVAISPLDDPTDFIATASIGASGFEGANIQIFPVNFPRDGRYILITSALLEPDAQPTDEYILLAGDFSFGTPQGTFLALDENGELVIREIQYTTPDGGVGGTVSVEGGVTVDDTTTTTTATNTSGTVTNNTGSPVNMYEGASTDSAVVSTLGIGETASVISAITDWYFIQRSDNSTGWVQASEVTFTADSTTTSSSTSDTTASTTSSSSNGNVTTLCPGVTLTCDQLFTCAEVQACVNAGSTVLDPNGNGVACDAADGINPLSCTVPYTP